MAELIMGPEQFKEIFSKYPDGTRVGYVYLPAKYNDLSINFSKHYLLAKAKGLFDVTLVILVNETFVTEFDGMVWYIDFYMNELAKIMPCDYIYYDIKSWNTVSLQEINLDIREEIKINHINRFGLSGIDNEYNFFRYISLYRFGMFRRFEYDNSFMRLPNLVFNMIMGNKHFISDNILFDTTLSFIEDYSSFETMQKTPRIYLPTYRYKSGIIPSKNNDSDIRIFIDAQGKVIITDITPEILTENKHILNGLNDLYKQKTDVTNINNFITNSIPLDHSYLLINPVTMKGATNDDILNDMVCCIVYPNDDAVFVDNHVIYTRKYDEMWLGFERTDIYERGYGFRKGSISDSLDLYLDGILNEMEDPAFPNRSHKYVATRIMEWYL